MIFELLLAPLSDSWRHDVNKFISKLISKLGYYILFCFWGKIIDLPTLSSLFPNYVPFVGDLAFYINNFESPSQKMICAKFQ